MIDLISDTSTRPTAAMRAAMAEAVVGDEQRGEDPTTTALCERVADMLGFEAAVLLPSGIMSNLIAILVHTRPGDEVILAENAHIVGSEGGSASAIAGVQLSMINAPDGRFTLDQLTARFRLGKSRAPRASLVCIEQTSNAGGGTCWSHNTLADIADAARAHGCAMHMDGARLLNASAATGRPPARDCAFFDSAWLDLSKGLGCPIGSVLCGSRAFIDEAWIWKNRLGGAMRQSGVIAAAGLYALDHHVDRLVTDHENARALAAGITATGRAAIVGDGVETNIVFIDVTASGLTAKEVSQALIDKGVRMGVVSEHRLRAVTHLEVSADDIAAAISAFSDVVSTPVHGGSRTDE
jgi:threonine aldolase